MARNYLAAARNYSALLGRKINPGPRVQTLKRGAPFFLNVTLRNVRFASRISAGPLKPIRPRIIGMIRLRNEELLLEDTLDHLAAFTDGIVVYDDASTDQSRQIALRHPHVIEVITNRHWRKTNRIWEETANRRMLYRRTLRHRPEWVFYSDADERFEGDIRETLLSGSFRDVQAVRVSLYDAYLTPDDRSPFTQGDVLWNFRRYFGPERRRILMAWRPGHLVDYRLPDSREPHGIEGVVVSSFSCQHYGKAQSEEQWDETCRYYIERFPDIYAEKWRKRLGRAIHTESDFGAPLVTWDQVEAHAVDI